MRRRCRSASTPTATTAARRTATTGSTARRGRVSLPPWPASPTPRTGRARSAGGCSWPPPRAVACADRQIASRTIGTSPWSPARSARLGRERRRQAGLPERAGADLRAAPRDRPASTRPPAPVEIIVAEEPAIANLDSAARAGVELHRSGQDRQGRPSGQGRRSAAARSAMRRWSRPARVRLGRDRRDGLLPGPAGARPEAAGHVPTCPGRVGPRCPTTPGSTPGCGCSPRCASSSADVIQSIGAGRTRLTVASPEVRVRNRELPVDSTTAQSRRRSPATTTSASRSRHPD